MALKFITSYLEDSLALFRYYKKLAERAMEWVTDEQLFATLDDHGHAAWDLRFGGKDVLGIDCEFVHNCPPLPLSSG
jgi:hypothetical protein